MDGCGGRIDGVFSVALWFSVVAAAAVVVVVVQVVMVATGVVAAAATVVAAGKNDRLTVPVTHPGDPI